jgi:hypothetical protein
VFVQTNARDCLWSDERRYKSRRASEKNVGQFLVASEDVIGVKGLKAGEMQITALTQTGRRLI